jgi:serine protease
MLMEDGSAEELLYTSEMKKEGGFLCLLLVVFFAGSAWVQAQEYLPNSIIFRLTTATSSNEVLSNRLEHELHGLKVKELWQKFPTPPAFKEKATKNPEGLDLSLIYEMKVHADMDMHQLAERLTQLSWIRYAQPHYLPKPAAVPNDPSLFRLRPYFDNMQLFQGWDIAKGDSTVIIGLLDTGTDPTHPDLVNNYFYNHQDPINGIDDDLDGYLDNFLGWDLGEDDNDVTTVKSGHGAHLSGVIAATPNNGIGISGTGYNCRLLPIKIDEDTTGTLIAAYEGIKYAADAGCQIINCSWGGYVVGEFEREMVEYAIKEKKCMLIASAGNDNRNDLFFPAAFDGVLAVTAVDDQDQKVFNSNFNEAIDLAAPGQLYYSTWQNGLYQTNTGTSVSTAVVSGITGILKAHYPKMQNDELIELMRSTSDFIYNQNKQYVYLLGRGRINLYRALKQDTSPDFDILDFKLYPNPVAKEQQNLLYYFYLEEAAEVKISMFSMAGQEWNVINKKHFDSGIYEYTLDLSNVQRGMYVLQYQRNGTIFTKKLVVH